MRCGECWACGWYTCSGIVSSAADVLWMGVVRGMRGVGGVCEMCMCLAWGSVGGEGPCYQVSMFRVYTQRHKSWSELYVQSLFWLDSFEVFWSSKRSGVPSN